jgi:ABC-type phosphate transport system permease subunit
MKSSMYPPSNHPADGNVAANASPNESSRRKSMQSGFSLLARGEPQIWCTGGMLAVCLAMVVSLLGLILASGLPTFWPRSVDWLLLRDGSMDVGEPQLSLVKSTKAGPKADSTTESRSYYYRTENFDLSNEHYRWFAADQLSEDGILRFPAVTLFERYEWGYLYGIPLRIHEPLTLPIDVQVRQSALSDLSQLLQTVSQSSVVGTDAQDKIESLNRVQAVLQDTRIVESNSAVREALAIQKDVTLQVRITGEDLWRIDSEVTPDAKLNAARIILTDRFAQLQRLYSITPKVYAARKRLDRLKRELSRLDAKITRLRVAVRQSELDTKSLSPVSLDDCHYASEQLVAIEAIVDQVAAAKRILGSVVMEKSDLESAITALEAYVSQDLKQQSSALDEQLTVWAQPAQSAPKEVKLAIENYLLGYREIIRQKMPLQSNITQLQNELKHGEVIVAVPNNARMIDGALDQDTVALVEGRISTALSEKLGALNIQIDGDTAPKAIYQSAVVSFISIQDSQKLTHLIRASGSTIQLLTEHPVAFEQLVRVVPVNELGLSGKMGVYTSRWGEFLMEDPREANTLGGVFPAICGTIAMTLIMTVAVVPFGILAALYLREYTRGGPLVSIIRISINNLAGVPSIVYGVFGFSFFCMTVGSFIDGGPSGANIVPWPSGTWFLVLGLVVVVGTTAFFCSFVSSGPSHSQTAVTRWLGKVALAFWIASLVIAVALIAKSPFFEGFYAAQLPNPTFGKGGLLWASMTLALLTLPVVIVATEEALSAVPNSLREGSLACGASKWQTIRRIVLPHARAGILTGAILAMARGAGEVAPLMLVGALPNAPELPLDGEFPFFHGSRNFMHLGYQIYSLGFQSQNSEAAKPMVFTCTLLLITIVAVLNISAIFLRSRLRRRFQGNQF